MTVLGAVLVAVGPAAAALAQDEAPRSGQVDVIEVSGYLDPVLVDFVRSSVDDAERSLDDDDPANDVIGLVLQLNSPGSVVSDEELETLVGMVQDAAVPVSTWIGPTGSRALGGAAELAFATTEIGMAPGTRLEDDRGRVLDDEEAVEQDVADRSAPTINNFLFGLRGFETELVDGEAEPVTVTRFNQLSIGSQVFHTAASPAVAYLFFVLGMGLILFELYTAGVGVAGVIAAGLFVFGCYGLAVLPARGWAVGLLVLSMAAFAIDVQTGVPRFWTGVGFISFAVGTLFLFDGPQLSWITLVGTFLALAVAVLAGMPAMVRTRFSTPTIGREWMIGEEGEAVTSVDPDGTVRVQNALWRARTNRATPLAVGDPVVVAGLDGLVLEVESTDPERRPKEHRRS
jgi:membrane-bound serine protease (ClpP class)